MKGWISPIAFHAGLPCSGHGIPIPASIHSVQACGTPPIPLGIAIKNKVCWWMPFPLIPISPLTVANALVLVHKLPIMLGFDAFIPHPTVTTNIVLYTCPCGKGVCIIPTPIVGSVLTAEDMGGIGHPRIVFPTTFTVWAMKRPVARVLDPLGFGRPFFSYPCNSVVAYGAPLVLSS